MEKFHLIFIPTDKKGLIISMEYTCRNVDAACEYATMQLLFSNGQFREAHVCQTWKSEVTFREAIDPIIVTNNI